MSNTEQQTGEMVVEDYTGDHYADSSNGTSGRMTDIAAGRKTTRPKVMLSAVVTCPECGSQNKPEWLNKSRHGDSYATTIWCEQCGGLIAIWAAHVDAQIVAAQS